MKETEWSNSVRQASFNRTVKKYRLRFITNKERLDINQQELQSFRLAIPRHKPPIQVIKFTSNHSVLRDKSKRRITIKDGIKIGVNWTEDKDDLDWELR